MVVVNNSKWRRRNNFRIVRVALAVAVTVIITGSISFGVFAKVSHSESTQYLYDECIDAIEKSEFEDSYCATYIGAFMDGYGAASYVMASEVYKRNLQDEFKIKSDCDKKSPDDLKEIVKIFISWVDDTKTSKKVSYDVLKSPYKETLGTMVWRELTCSGEKEVLEISSLEMTCKRLSQKTRKNYEPIVGRYIENKSLARVVESTRSVPEYTSVITLVYEGKEIELHSNTMTEVEFHGHYRPILEQVISVHINDANPQAYVYGVCGYRDEKNKYRHEIETLSLVKGGE